MKSSSCSICGSTQTTILDGLMYCATCGTQIFDFREVEADEEALVIGSAKVRSKKSHEVRDKSRASASGPQLSTSSGQKRRKGEKLEGYCSAASTSANRSELAKDYTTGRNHAPAYLRTIGLRISTFTKMLAKGAVMICQDRAVPSGFSGHVLAIYQRYLSACNVAFTSSDYTEEAEHMFRAVVLNTNLAFSRAREKKESKLRKKKLGKEALEKSTTAWELLMGTTLNENLEMLSDEEETHDNDTEPASSTTPAKQSQLVNVIDTNIPKETLKNAASLFLSLDVFAALLYISTVTIGCRWIMLSDILRWIREGRLGISLFQLTALHTGSLDEVKMEGSWWAKLNLPLSEFQGTVLFIWQLCRLPPTPAKIDFHQIVSRILYHLNLPEDLMQHVFLLMEKAPPCVSLYENSLRRQGRIEQGSFSHGFSTAKDGFGYNEVMTVFGRPRLYYKNNSNTDIFFSTETKAVALILMALKLCFGLDDKREFYSPALAVNTSNNTFNFMHWYYQLKMRLMFWEGYDPLDVLQKNKPVEPLLYDRNFSLGQFLNNNEVSSDEGASFYRIVLPTRESGFDHCVPASMKIDNSTSIPNPFPEDTCDIKPNLMDDESLYVPLRRQTTALREYLLRPRTTAEKQEVRNIVDETAVKIFKTEFTKCALAQSLPVKDDSISTTHNAKTSAGAQRTRWYSYFPCAKGYVRYPRPHFTNGGIVHLKEDDIRLLNFNRDKMGLTMTASGLRMLFASQKGALEALEVAKPAMSHTFTNLLHWFSKIIGESESVLYCAFMMLEFQIADRQRFDNMRQSMIDERVFPVKSRVIHRFGKLSYETVYISPAEEVSEASEIEIVRLGLPRLWASSVNERSVDEVASEEYDYSSESSEGGDSEASDPPVEQDDKKLLRCEVPCTPQETVANQMLPLSTEGHFPPSNILSATTKRERHLRQYNNRSYEFDLIWMLITMRYW